MLPVFQRFTLPIFLVLFTAGSFFYTEGIHTSSRHDIKSQGKQIAKSVLGQSKKIAPTPSISENPHGIQSETKTISGQSAQNGDTSSHTPSVLAIRPSSQAITSATNTGSIGNSLTPIVQNSIIKATTTISSGGKTIRLAMQYPSIGGAISGTISGDCTGIISGTYDGPLSGTLHGTGTATCPMGFLSVPVTISYSGKLLSSSQATISYTAAALGKTETGSTVLVLTQ